VKQVSGNGVVPGSTAGVSHRRVQVLVEDILVASCASLIGLRLPA
jgi:hypothetical protein